MAAKSPRSDESDVEVSPTKRSLLTAPASSPLSPVSGGSGPVLSSFPLSPQQKQLFTWVDRCGLHAIYPDGVALDSIGDSPHTEPRSLAVGRSNAELEKLKLRWLLNCLPVIIQPQQDVEHGYPLLACFVEWKLAMQRATIRLVFEGEGSYNRQQPSEPNRVGTYLYRTYNFAKFGRTADIKTFQYRNIDFSSFADDTGILPSLSASSSSSSSSTSSISTKRPSLSKSSSSGLAISSSFLSDSVSSSSSSSSSSSLSPAPPSSSRTPSSSSMPTTSEPKAKTPSSSKIESKAGKATPSINIKEEVHLEFPSPTHPFSPPIHKSPQIVLTSLSSPTHNARSSAQKRVLPPPWHSIGSYDFCGPQLWSQGAKTSLGSYSFDHHFAGEVPHNEWLCFGEQGVQYNIGSEKRSTSVTTASTAQLSASSSSVSASSSLESKASMQTLSVPPSSNVTSSPSSSPAAKSSSSNREEVKAESKESSFSLFRRSRPVSRSPSVSSSSAASSSGASLSSSSAAVSTSSSSSTTSSSSSAAAAAAVASSSSTTSSSSSSSSSCSSEAFADPSSFNDPTYLWRPLLFLNTQNHLIGPVDHNPEMVKLMWTKYYVFEGGAADAVEFCKRHVQPKPNLLSVVKGWFSKRDNALASVIFHPLHVWDQRPPPQQQTSQQPQQNR